MNAKPVVIDGAYARLFADFVEFKRGIGYGYSGPTIQQLRMFSRYLSNFPETGTVLDKETVDEYCAPHGAEAISTRKHRATLVRQFALYLRTRGIDCYLPPENHERDRTDFIPHIFTENEMQRVIACADDHPFLPHASTTKAVYSMLIRMLWCCGLRLGEALSLTVGDVNLDDAVLTVARAKYNKTRLVPMSKSLAAYAKRYWDHMGFVRENPGAFFYPTHRNGKYVRGAPSAHIKRIMLRAGIANSGGKVPRVHDIRHSFAVMSLKKMEDAGMDIYCSLPLLSVYMGHSDIKSTEYYLRLTGSSFSEIHNAMDSCYNGIFPEVV